MSEENIKPTIIGRRALKSLVVVKGRYGEDVCVTKRLMKDGNEENTFGKIASVLGESNFNSGGLTEENKFQDDNFYFDFGDDP